MIALIRVAQVLLILVLGGLAVSLVIGVAAPETGLAEKLVLVVMFGGCVLLAARVTHLAGRLTVRARSR